MTEADKANEVREEKVATQIARKIAAIPENRPEHAADHKLRAIEEIIENTIKMVERHTGKELRDQLSKDHREKEKLKELHIHQETHLNDQLSNEREKVDLLKRSMKQGNELYANLKFDDEPFTPYQIALQELQKEREMRKELVDFLERDKHRFDLVSSVRGEIESLIAKATELDKK